MKFKKFLKILNPLLWLAISIYFGQNINKFLIENFDSSRLRYILLILPSSFLIMLGSLGLMGWLVGMTENVLISYCAAVISVVFVGIPLCMSLPLWCFLFMQTYCELFARLNFPLAGAGVWYCKQFVKAFRPGERFSSLFW